MADLRRNLYSPFMHSALYYVLALTGLVFVAGSAIAFFALRSAPEGFEDEDGFTGVTKGDQQLLQEFAAQQRYSSSHQSSGMAA